MRVRKMTQLKNLLHFSTFLLSASCLAFATAFEPRSYLSHPQQDDIYKLHRSPIFAKCKVATLFSNETRIPRSFPRTFQALSGDLISSCIQIGEAVLGEREQGTKQHRDGGQRLLVQLVHSRPVQQVSLHFHSLGNNFPFYFYFEII